MTGMDQLRVQSVPAAPPHHLLVISATLKSETVWRMRRGPATEARAQISGTRAHGRRRITVIPTPWLFNSVVPSRDIWEKKQSKTVECSCFPPTLTVSVSQ